MHTIRLKINDKVFEKIIWLLSKFGKDELEIINEDSDFIGNQKYLGGEIREIIKGKATFIGFDEVEQRLENTINRHENSV